MRRENVFALLALLSAIMIFLIGCVGGRYSHVVGDKDFENAEAARAYNRAQIEKDLASVRPLEVPIAEIVVLILPPREQLAENSPMLQKRAAILAGWASKVPLQHRQAALDRLEDSTVWAEAETVKRSNIFRKVEVIRFQYAEPSMAPHGGFLIWTELSEEEGQVHRHIVSAGQQKFHRLPWNTNAPAAARIDAWLSQVIAYVQDNPPM